MSTREQLNQVLDALPEIRLHDALEYARFLSSLDQGAKEELDAWRQFGKKQFAKCYADDEPDYSSDNIKSELGA
jgi:hypothetical protein